MPVAYCNTCFKGDDCSCPSIRVMGNGNLTPQKAMNISTILAEVGEEVMRATSVYLPLNSPHEAHSVIEEEFDEFWDEVKAYNLRKGHDTRPRMREELIQLAAMAVRAVTAVIDNGKPTGETRGNTDTTPVQATPTVG